MRNLKYTDKKLKKTSFLKNVVVLVVAHIFIKIIGVINKRSEFKYQKLTEDFLHEWYKKQPINREIVEIAKKLKKNEYNLFVLSNMANLT